MSSPWHHGPVGGNDPWAQSLPKPKPSAPFATSGSKGGKAAGPNAQALHAQGGSWDLGAA